MTVDLLAASRRPLQRLLHDCSFSEWENIALFLDGGSTEAVRWAGGLGFVLEELGISQVVDLQVGGTVSGYCTSKVSQESMRRCYKRHTHAVGSCNPWTKLLSHMTNSHAIVD